MKEQSFADFLLSAMNERGWNNRILASVARVSFRSISEIRSGKLDQMLKSGELSDRKRKGVTVSTHRILVGLGVDPKPWMEKLGLKVPDATRLPARSFNTLVTGILHKPVVTEDIEHFAEAQKILEDLFTTEILLKLLLKRK